MGYVERECGIAGFPESVRRGKGRMTPMYRFCWVLWIGGTAVIVASWLNIVTPAVGWVGFGIALAGTLLSLTGQQRQQPPAKPPEPHSQDETGTA